MPIQCNTTLEFPSCRELLQLRRGEWVASDRFTVAGPDGGRHAFRVLLYPRGLPPGRDHSTSPRPGWNPRKERSGFGMSYRILPLFPTSPGEDRVGVYLQYLPEAPDASVDASFRLRLVGNQAAGPRFDVEWRTGMRFVAAAAAKLAEGRANDFGSHLLQTPLLPAFAGGTNGTDPVRLVVGVTIHEARQSDEMPADVQNSLRSLSFDDLRTQGDHHSQVRVGSVVVPIVQRLSQRPGAFELGAYPGVEYRIMRIADPATDRDLFYSRPGVDYELKPLYPLVPQLERQWPVRVNERDIPKLITPAAYNAISAIGSLATAVTGLLLAFVVSQAVSLFVIPSLSMDPTLQVGDVLLVDKVTPRLVRRYPVDGVVLFRPPPRLQGILQSAVGGSRLGDRDLFVKRVAAGPGDRMTVSTSGTVAINGHDATTGLRDLCQAEPLRLIEKFIDPHSDDDPLIVPPGQVAVLGDCGSVSIDSRVWGTLPVDNIVGRPLLRLWPLSRFGAVSQLPSPTGTGTGR